MFANMLILTPRTRRDDATTACNLYEIGTGAGRCATRSRSPPDEDAASENRGLGNAHGPLSLLSGLTAQSTLGTDSTAPVRRTFAARQPARRAANGRRTAGAARTHEPELQPFLTCSPHPESQDVRLLGGDQYTKFDNTVFENSEAEN